MSASHPRDVGSVIGGCGGHGAPLLVVRCTRLSAYVYKYCTSNDTSQARMYPNE